MRMPDEMNQHPEPQANNPQKHDGEVDNHNLPEVIEPDFDNPDLALSPVDSIILEIQNQTPVQVEDIPWTLQQFFNGEIDLETELATRFDGMPLMSQIKFRSLGSQTGRGVATISAPDGSAQVVFDADKNNKVVHMSFTLGSMLTLRFSLTDLSNDARQRWLDLMKRDEGGLTFLWGPARWEKDYLICVTRKYFTNLYAFSPHNFNAAIRMTPEVTRKLLDWMNEYWQGDGEDEDDTPHLLTW